MLAQVRERDVVACELLCPAGQQDLAAVPRCRDARAGVDGHADVPFIRHLWLAGVKTNADADRARSEGFLSFPGRGHGVRCFGEREEEGVALCIHFDAPSAC